jgi:hypothetical protein
MKNNLNMVREGIESFDNDGEKSLFFYNNPQARVQLLQELLEFSVAKLDNITDRTENRSKAKEIIKWLDSNYHGYEWSAHEVHFHTSFYQFASCPFTCLNEISSMIEKLIKEKFAA